jgi:hypothetical protein
MVAAPLVRLNPPEGIRFRPPRRPEPPKSYDHSVMPSFAASLRHIRRCRASSGVWMPAVEDFGLDVLAVTPRRHEELRRRIVELVVSLRRFAATATRRRHSAAAAATISRRLGDRVVLVAGDDELQAAIVASLPVTGGTGSTPAAFSAAIAPPVPSLAATIPLISSPKRVIWPACPFLCLRRRPIQRVEFGERLKGRSALERAIDARRG